MAYTWPLAQVGQRYLVTIKSELFAQTIMSTFWYTIDEFTGAPSIEQAMDALAVRLNVAGNLVDDYRACVPPQLEMQEMWIQCIDPTRYVKKVYALGVDGTWAGDAYTANVAGVISRRGVTGTRKSQGSLHVPIASGVESLIGAELTAGLLGVLSALGTTMALAQVDASATVWLPILRGGPGLLQFEFIGACSAQKTARVMRRRTKGVGI